MTRLKKLPSSFAVLLQAVLRAPGAPSAASSHASPAVSPRQSPTRRPTCHGKAAPLPARPPSTGQTAIPPLHLQHQQCVRVTAVADACGSSCKNWCGSQAPGWCAGTTACPTLLRHAADETEHERKLHLVAQRSVTSHTDFWQASDARRPSVSHGLPPAPVCLVSPRRCSTLSLSSPLQRASQGQAPVLAALLPHLMVGSQGPAQTPAAPPMNGTQDRPPASHASQRAPPAPPAAGQAARRPPQTVAPLPAPRSYLPTPNGGRCLHQMAGRIDVA